MIIWIIKKWLVSFLSNKSIFICPSNLYSLLWSLQWSHILYVLHYPWFTSCATRYFKGSIIRLQFNSRLSSRTYFGSFISLRIRLRICITFFIVILCLNYFIYFYILYKKLFKSIKCKAKFRKLIFLFFKTKQFLVNSCKVLWELLLIKVLFNVNLSLLL